MVRKSWSQSKNDIQDTSGPKLGFLRRLARQSPRDTVRSLVIGRGLELLLPNETSQLRWHGHNFWIAPECFPWEVFQPHTIRRRPVVWPRTWWRDNFSQLAWECLVLCPALLVEMSRSVSSDCYQMTWSWIRKTTTTKCMCLARPFTIFWKCALMVQPKSTSVLFWPAPAIWWEWYESDRKIDSKKNTHPLWRKYKLNSLNLRLPNRFAW